VQGTLPHNGLVSSARFLCEGPQQALDSRVASPMMLSWAAGWAQRLVLCGCSILGCGSPGRAAQREELWAVRLVGGEEIPCSLDMEGGKDSGGII